MAKKKTTKKAPKKKKIESLPKIKRRLFKLWSLAVRERGGHQCEYCGIKKGDLNKNDKVTKIDAHHILSRDVKDCPLKFDIMNGIGVCPFCHKFGIPSFHRDPVTTITWLQEHRPDRYEYVLKNVRFTVDLDNRKVLAEIEERLNANESLDLEKLSEIEKEFPRKERKPKSEIEEGSLFEAEAPEEETPEDAAEAAEDDDLDLDLDIGL
jgi:hypothetical protein